jgi:hypothetical protein
LRETAEQLEVLLLGMVLDSALVVVALVQLLLLLLLLLWVLLILALPWRTQLRGRG